LLSAFAIFHLAARALPQATMKLQHVHSVLISLVQTCVATQFLTRETLPEGSFSETCVEALVADIACPLQVSRFSNGRYFPDAALVDACTPSCSSALASYGDDILSSCGESDYYEISDSDLVPAAVIPLRYRYYYNKTCIQDGDRWCHGFAREVAEGTLPMDECDDCLIKQYQFVAGSPLYAGYELRSSYTALTQRCSKTDFPLPPTSSISIPEYE
jgi:hypothetical protein